MKTRYWLCVCVAVAGALIAKPAAAQQTADIIRGRVIGPDSLPIKDVNILVTSFMGGINKTAKSDKNGRFSVVFPNGEGDYWVGFAAIGYTFKRFELKRVGDEEILIADTKLEKSAVRLDTVSITANAARGTPPRNQSTMDASGTDKFVSSANIGAGQAGNLAAMVGGLPGFQFIPGVDGNPDMFSVLGLTPDQNSTTLNGANANSGDIPRDASVGVSASVSPWDVTRGGFSGAQVQLTTQSGNNYLARSVSGQFDSPGMQWTDRIGNSTAAQYTRMSPGARFSGSLAPDRNFYSTSFQFDRTLRDLQTLFNTSDYGLQTAGVSPDSAARLRTVLQTLGIPSTVPGVGDPTVNSLRQQGAFDFAPKAATSGSAYQLAENFNWSHNSPTSTSLMATPAFSGENQNIQGVAVARHTNYFWTSVLTQSWLSASVQQTKNSPNLTFPSANVRVSSELDDGTATVRTLQFGGNQSLGINSSNAVFGAKNQLQWYAGNNKHTIKLVSELKQDSYAQDNPSNRLGTFTFQSLADLEAGKPSQYTRQLANLHEDAKQMAGVLAISDAWRPTTTVQVVYGLRLDGNRFMTTPAYNPAVEQAVGVRNDFVPNRMYVSPRVGVSWNYGQASVIPFGEGYFIGPRASVRAGAGVYQNVAGANLLGSTLTQTGLPGASQILTCVGETAPVPDWDTYRTNPTTVPSECANGSSVFASSLPGVSLFDHSYSQARTARANVNWNGPILDNRFTVTVDATYSLGLNQTGAVDLNFNPTQRFALDNEGGRPVFVMPTSVDPASGFIAARDARVSPAFTAIHVIKSNLRNEARQLTVSLAPFTFNPTRFRWSGSYTLTDFRDRFNGFSSTAGSPLDYAWGHSSAPQHQISYFLSYNFWDYVTVSWQGGFHSGVRFTPRVAGDINGDGTFGNDRAFVFDPATATDPTVATAMQALVTGGDAAARGCLKDQLGTVATRNSCTGPWTASAGSLSIRLNSMKVWMPPRTTFTLQVQNPLVAADLLLHGSNGLHGWGETPPPDANLLFVRGFDPATQRYQYEVNQRFGSTSLQQNVRRSPVIVTAGFSLDVAPTRDWQSLKIGLERGRSRPGTKMTDAQIRSMSSALGVVNPMATILRSRDAMRLTRKQADSLSNLSRTFTIKIDSIWKPVAEYYLTLGNDFNRGLAHEKFVAAREAAADYLISIAPGVKEMLTAQQFRKLSSGIQLYLEPRYLQQLRAGLVGGGIGMEMMIMSMR